MNEFKFTPDVEFKNSYNNAKLDVLKAMASVQRLPENQQRQLAEELLGSEAIAMRLRIMYEFLQNLQR